ncbi:MAG TPA: O-antigen ligase family protein [Gammaproteobacteria bacterium]
MHTDSQITRWRRNAGAPQAASFTASSNALPFRALMAFTFFLLISPQSFFPVLAPLRIALITAIVAVCAHLFDRFVRRRPFMEFSREIIIAACILGWAVLTVPLSYWPGGSVSYLVNMFAKTLIVFWLLTQLVNTLPRLKFVIWSLSLIAIPLALSGVMNLIVGNFAQPGLALNESRIVGYDAPLTANPNDLALTLNLILPLSISLFLASKKPGIRALLLACICLDAIGVVATYSRGGFLTLAVTVGIYLFTLLKRRHEQHWVLLALFLIVAALPFLPAGYVDRLSTITDIESDTSGSAQARWGDTIAALGYVLFHPIIGAGLGMNMLALNEVRGPTWTEIHNVYLQYAMDLGIPGLILFLMLLIGTIKNMRLVQRLSTAARNWDLFYLAEGIRVSLIAFAVAAFFHPVGYHFYFYYIAGLAVATKAISIAGADKTTVGDTVPPRVPMRRLG